MNQRWRGWIPAIVVWTWLLVSIALVGRHPWLNTAWNAAWMLLILVVVVGSVVHITRHRHETGSHIAYRWMPRWVVTLFAGGDSK